MSSSITVRRGSDVNRTERTAKVLSVCPRRTVLVAEDEALVLGVLTRVLVHPAYHIIAREDGSAALKATADGRVDLIIADMDMPKMGGVELCTHLIQRGVRAPVILITGCVPAGVDTSRLPPNVAACLQKPFDIDLMLQTVDRLLAAASCRPPLAPTYQRVNVG